MSISAPPTDKPAPPETLPDFHVTELRQSRWMSILHALPTVVVLALLGGVLYAGHHTGWKLPKMSVLLGTPAESADDWCSEHLVPESQCVECDKDLLPRPNEFGFCRKHGVAECVIDHPELAQVEGTPRLPAYDTAGAIAVRPRPENNSRNTLHKRKVQFASLESVAKAGIDVDVVQERPMADFLTANAELVFDPTRVVHMSARVSGTVAAVLKTVGDEVRAGDIVAIVDAAAVGQAKSQLLTAIVQWRLKRSSVERLRGAASAVPGKVLVEAEAALQEAEVTVLSARQALVNLGFEVPDDLEQKDAGAAARGLRLLGLAEPEISALPAATRTANLIPIRAPYDGAIIASDVVAGEVVDSARVLFTVADPQQMWLTLNVRQEDARLVTRGLPVRFTPDDGSAEASGWVSWMSPAVDERTRTLQVRVKLDNREGRLRSHTFGTGRIILREEPRAIVVPREAVQSTSDAHFVFVRDRDFLKPGSLKVFHVRQVRLGARDEGFVELLAGALPGEVVATKGSPVLLAQLLRSNLGAGCGCHEH